MPRIMLVNKVNVLRVAKLLPIQIIDKFAETEENTFSRALFSLRGTFIIILLCNVK